MAAWLRAWWLGLATALALADGTAAQQKSLVGRSVQERANGVLQVLGFTAVPDSTAATLAISNGNTGNPHFNQTQFGGGFTVSPDVPVYLEGFLGAARYDPTFVFSNGLETSVLPTRWTGVSATGGVGWDFRLTDTLVFRPMVNLSLGYVTSDLNLALVITDIPEPDFLDGGQLFALGYGGSVMLDYELRRPDYDVDIELRYTHLRMTSLSFTSADVRGEADTQTAALWTRLRIPVGDIAGRPFRYVFEAAHSEFLGAQRGALGFTGLSQVGLGVEIDTTADDILLTRSRLVGRYVFGENISGFSIGVGITF